MRFRWPRWASRRQRSGPLDSALVSVPDPDTEATWRISAASVPGTSHLDSGRGCDDAFAYAIQPDGRGVVIAVADGAGSRSGTSALGSFAACRAVIAESSSLLAAASTEIAAGSALRQCFTVARAAVETYAGEQGLQARDLATTLAVAVLTPTAAAVAQVGDGIIVCEVDGQMVSLVPEEKGEYANETVFLTASNALDEHLRVRFLDKPISRVALSTDGLRYKILRLKDGGVPFEPFFAAVWQAVADGSLLPSALSDWLRGLDDQTGDDKTLVVGTFVEGPFPGRELPAALAFSPPPAQAAADPISESAP